MTMLSRTTGGIGVSSSSSITSQHRQDFREVVQSRLLDGRFPFLGRSIGDSSAGGSSGRFLGGASTGDDSSVVLRRSRFWFIFDFSLRFFRWRFCFWFFSPSSGADSASGVSSSTEAPSSIAPLLNLRRLVLIRLILLAFLQAVLLPLQALLLQLADQKEGLSGVDGGPVGGPDGVLWELGGPEGGLLGQVGLRRRLFWRGWFDPFHSAKCAIEHGAKAASSACSRASSAEVFFAPSSSLTMPYLVAK